MSDQGRVKSISNQLFLKTGEDKDGYLYVTVYPGKVCCKVSWLVLEAFIGERPNGFHACHNNGNPGDDRLENLRWDTPSANALDAVKHGTFVDNSGSKNGRSKLKEHQVLTMLLKYEQGVSLKDLAKDYGLHSEYVRLVVKRVYWSHLKVPFHLKGKNA